jgi:hypothetical protein
MSRKDYIKMAALLKAQREGIQNLESLKIVDSVIKATADMFAEDNPRFDRDRYLKACGVK